MESGERHQGMLVFLALAPLLLHPSATRAATCGSVKYEEICIDESPLYWSGVINCTAPPATPTLDTSKCLNYSQTITKFTLPPAKDPTLLAKEKYLDSVELVYYKDYGTAKFNLTLCLDQNVDFANGTNVNVGQPAAVPRNATNEQLESSTITVSPHVAKGGTPHPSNVTKDLYELIRAIQVNWECKDNLKTKCMGLSHYIIRYNATANPTFAPIALKYIKPTTNCTRPTTPRAPRAPMAPDPGLESLMAGDGQQTHDQMAFANVMAQQSAVVELKPFLNSFLECFDGKWPKIRANCSEWTKKTDECYAEKLKDSRDQASGKKLMCIFVNTTKQYAEKGFATCDGYGETVCAEEGARQLDIKKVAMVVAVVAGIVFLAAAFMCWMKRRRKKKAEKEAELDEYGEGEEDEEDEDYEEDYDEEDEADVMDEYDYYGEEAE